MATPYDRKLVLETGEEFYGRGFGDNRESVGEVVFDTTMVGYQEIVSDPAYAFQIVVMTYPVIGNYGISDDDFESRAPLAAGLVVRDYNDQPSNFRYTRTLAEVLEDSHIPGICEVDTRRLARLIRDGGSRRALLTSAETPVEKALERLAETPVRRDAVECVSCKKRWYYRTSNHRFNVVAVDLGIKLSVVRCLSARGCNVTVVPWNTSAEAILAMKPDGVLFSGGPGDPRDIPETIETARALRGKLPIFGIGEGHQVVALAYGARVYKLKSGHHGGNHPVRCLETGALAITAQNHNYAVDAGSLKDTGLRLTHVDILDDTVEGLDCEEDRLLTAQYLSLIHIYTLMQALRAGFGSIMYDGSRESHEDNLQHSAAIARIAHGMGVGLECELGSVSGLADEAGHEDKMVYTEPSEAAAFLERTGADFLAVSIGTVHGVYKAEPHLDIPLSLIHI